MERKIIRIGNSLGVTLSSDLLSKAGLREGSLVDVRADEGGLYVKPASSFGQQVRTWRRDPLSLRASPADIVDAIRADRESR